MNRLDREATHGNTKASRVREAIDNLNASNLVPLAGHLLCTTFTWTNAGLDQREAFLDGDYEIGYTYRHKR